MTPRLSDPAPALSSSYARCSTAPASAASQSFVRSAFRDQATAPQQSWSHAGFTACCQQIGATRWPSPPAPGAARVSATAGIPPETGTNR